MPAIGMPAADEICVFYAMDGMRSRLQAIRYTNSKKMIIDDHARGRKPSMASDSGSPLLLFWTYL